ncbi:hypothetical protein Glove_363g7 [Diversispora epigaea]|uniref:Splicing factor YJU2 n=1 Tax=Diversispora epigaea TaxID=1348612 RepID=A0A397HD67_9GLOM|nr:hypothetical protein Glove_363g7 [Diversispora epigaea]
MQPFNKYYPPDWTPDKGSVNKYVGKHPLGDRARKIDQGVLIVRFELPFNIWCEGCGNHVGRGVRYNAEKKKIGKYFSTPIFSFRMKCHLCDNWIEIHTDPKSSEYIVVNGARKKVETWEPEDTETIQLKDEEEAKKLVDNAFYKLEQTVKDEEKSKQALPILTRLQILNDKQWADPYTHSQRMRKKFREEKKNLESIKRADDEIRDRNSLSIPLLPESSDDIVKAKTTEFSDRLLIQAQKRKLEINTSSIFKKPNHHHHKSKKLMTKSSSSKSLSSSLINNKSKNKNISSNNNNNKKVIAQLSSIISVNTKLKTDPFLKDNDWNNNNNNGNDLNEDDDNNNGNNNNNSGDKGDTIKNDILIVKRKEFKEGPVSLVSAEYGDDDDD